MCSCKRASRLDARHIALAAAMGHGTLPVRRKPRVAILATGDELVRAGEPRRSRPDHRLEPARHRAHGGEGRRPRPIDLGIARDTLESLDERIEAAKAAGADILVTLGGASVGEHDLVQKALARQGMDLGFWRVALRPGKPLMHGRLGSTLLLGLPGNPVSSLVCADPVPGARHPGAPGRSARGGRPGGGRHPREPTCPPTGTGRITCAPPSSSRTSP